MLQIDIVGFDPITYDLKLEVGGNPNNGNSGANRTERVHWKVKTGYGVDYIDNIKMKNIAGSTDIFSGSEPVPQGGDKKHWKGVVNGNAKDYDVYVYKIMWVKEHETTPRTFDPIISIKPDTYFAQILPALAVVLGLVSISLLFSSKKKKSKKPY